MRHMGSCELCSTKYPTAGQLLAWHVSQTVQTIKNYGRTANAPVYPLSSKYFNISIDLLYLF